jgi:ammonium transporter, Amt family
VKAKFGYDDSLDAFGIHGIGGIVGAIGTGGGLPAVPWRPRRRLDRDGRTALDPDLQRSGHDRLGRYRHPDRGLHRQG